MKKPVVHTEGGTDFNMFHSGSAELTEVKSGNNVVVVQQVSRCDRILTGSAYAVQVGNIFTVTLNAKPHSKFGFL